MIIRSNFNDFEEIPNAYACDGFDINPRIEIENIPNDTKSIAIIVDDPDALDVAGKIWVHWLVWDIVPKIRNVLSNDGSFIRPIALIEENSKPGVSGKNDSGKIGWQGPCPPKGKPHHYYFKIYALKERLNLKEGSTREELEKAMKDKIINRAELVGIYGR